MLWLRYIIVVVVAYLLGTISAGKIVAQKIGHVDISKVGVSFKSQKGEIVVCVHGAGVDFSEEKAKEILLEKEIEILVTLDSGDKSATAWGCDLTYDYVKINGDYRT